jgi:hypothetical protein
MATSRNWLHLCPFEAVAKIMAVAPGGSSVAKIVSLCPVLHLQKHSQILI